MNETDELKKNEVETTSTEPPDIPGRLECLEQAVKGLSDEIKEFNNRLGLIPQQVRQLGIKVDDITESIAHPRTRDMLNRLVQLYDLVTQMGQGERETGNPGDFRVLGDQVMQILEVNGIYPIPMGERFDPNLHKAMERVDCQTPEEDGEIARLYRVGFRTDRAILRYAEVLVKKYNIKEEIKEDGPNGAGEE
jgi:molecular chaperone GrpE (heat shock protein)